MLREEILDKIIEMVAKEYGLTVTQVTQSYSQFGKRANKNIAEAKRVICYLFPILLDLNYRVLMKKLNYEEKTHGSLTKNRKRVWQRMAQDSDYRRQVNQLKDNVQKEIERMVNAWLTEVIGDSDLNLCFVVSLRWNEIAVLRNSPYVP